LNLPDLLKSGNKLKALFDSLSEKENQLEFQNCLGDIHEWLDECVAYGRFLPDPSPDRRALQGRVDYWTSGCFRSVAIRYPKLTV